MKAARARAAPGTARRRGESGQMTVELAVTFPILLVVALIAMNALLFFSDCAAFDNEFREAVRVNATSPAYGQSTEDSAELVEEALAESFDRENLSVSVSAGDATGDYVTFSGTLEFEPTLFGRGLASNIFGVPIRWKALSHTVEFTVDVYNSSVLF